MKTISSRLVSVVLAVIIAFSAVVPSFAVFETVAWEVMWDKEYNNGVVLFPGSDNSEMNVSWYCAEEAEPKVLLSSSEALLEPQTFTGYCVEAADGDYSCKVTLTGLEAGERYFYQCISGDFESAVYSFKTDAKPNEFTACYITDIHISHNDEDPDGIKKTAATVNSLADTVVNRHGVSIFLSTGDQASEGYETEYKGLASVLSFKSIPIATTIGNHDRKGIAYKTFTNMPNEQDDAAVTSYIGRNYWFRKGNALFLVVDSNNASGADHRKFIKQAVKANPDAKWKIMMAHHDLFSGRIPHRESENALLRMIWGPLCDEFGIDLMLLGHSHYYTVSNVLYNNKTRQPLEKSMENPEGTIYMVSGSITRPRDDSDEDIGLNEDWIGAWNKPNDKQIYNILDFTENKLTVSSYYKGEAAAFNQYSITKTSNEGGHPKQIIGNPWDAFVRVIGTIYAHFNNIGVYSDLKEDGFKVNYFDVVF